ncbi:hypothetical protein I6F10_05000 [Pseudoalteromonas sp. SWYJZ98]|uniref:hypothetical protein n=1 Tax=Pseudoalteromonas sp. SWYJZ98 TaxID=2792060 RepID=UPI0018CE4082|nr:hypothetical protein [Pseudoalteromonas sp. SWYJZ98]MBH0030270.1 hypothetical protein [Pseudoalteromonas sp. SWYJZ98]
MIKKNKNQQVQEELNTILVGNDLMMLSIAKHGYTNNIKTKNSGQFLHYLENYCKRNEEYKKKVNSKVLNEYTKIKEKILEQYYHTKDSLNIQVHFNDKEKVSILYSTRLKNNAITLQLILESIVHGVSEKLSEYSSSSVDAPKNSVLLSSKLPILMYNLVSFDYKLDANLLTIKNIKLKPPATVYNKDVDYFYDNTDACKPLLETAQNINKLGFV